MPASFESRATLCSDVPPRSPIASATEIYSSSLARSLEPPRPLIAIISSSNAISLAAKVRVRKHTQGRLGLAACLAPTHHPLLKPVPFLAANEDDDGSPRGSLARGRGACDRPLIFRFDIKAQMQGRREALGIPSLEAQICLTVSKALRTDKNAPACVLTCVRRAEKGGMLAS